MEKEEILQQHTEYIKWIESLSKLTKEESTTPYKEDKWSPNEIIMHLAEWDRFTLEERMPYMKEGEKLESFPNFEAFNAKAAARAHEQTFEETLAYAKNQRQSIIQKLQQIDEQEWDKIFFIGNHEVTIRGYFQDFIEHDLHHKQQIKL